MRIFEVIKHPFKIGDTKNLSFLVSEKDLAEFKGGMVHPFYATFALGRDAEWTSRQFVLEMLEADEEGIGTFLTIEHLSPALLGETVRIVAAIVLLEKNAISCSYEVSVGDRIIAIGTTGQKILKKEKVVNLIAKITSGREKEN